MTSETAKVKSRLSILTSSFDDLEDLLEPLFSLSLPETLMGLEPIQQAKLQTLLPYLVYDLIFIYLKTRGIDPKSHPVISELDRVKQYFKKVANAETVPDKPAIELDKDAAGRFIEHAIAQISKQLPQDEPKTSSSASSASAATIPVKVTSKMLARAQYQRELREKVAQSSDEEGLRVIDDTSNFDNETSVDVDKPVLESSKRVLDISANSDPRQARNKLKRPCVDPFAGYGDEIPKSAHSMMSQSYSASPQIITTNMSSGTSTPLSIDEDSQRSFLSTTHGSKKKRSKRQKIIQQK